MQHFNSVDEVMSAAIEWEVFEEVFQLSGPHKSRNMDRLNTVADGDKILGLDKKHQCSSPRVN